MSDYEVVIGLEVHAQLLTRTKMFCGCSAKFGGPPNSQTCPICQGMPGVLPVINRRAIEFAVRTALAFNCTVNPGCRFARKHYYYPDMPKNYQISQYEEPLAEHGWLEIDVDGETRRVGIQRLHLEEDVGKLVHEGALETAQSSLVDFNRSGVPLMETVSKPDIRSPEEAVAYLKAFRAILVYLEVCDGNMEEGSMRCDANISLRPSGASEFGTKVEIKNMNSFKNVQRALEFEIERQSKALRAGERIVQETRLWNADKERTLSMRSKEFAHDYRYFPEPDLVPLTGMDAAFRRDYRLIAGSGKLALAGTVANLIVGGDTELPRAKRQRFIDQYSLPAYDADLLTSSRALADYYEEVVRLHPNPKAASNWIMSELLRELHGDPDAVSATPIRPQQLAKLIKLIDDGTISGKIAKEVFEKMAKSGEDPEAIVKREGLVQVTDADALAGIVDQVIAQNPGAAQDFANGKKQSLGFLVGQVMKATQGKANPQLVNRLLTVRLTKLPEK